MRIFYRNNSGYPQRYVCSCIRSIRIKLFQCLQQNLGPLFFVVVGYIYSFLGLSNNFWVQILNTLLDCNKSAINHNRLVKIVTKSAILDGVQRQRWRWGLQKECWETEEKIKVATAERLLRRGTTRMNCRRWSMLSF